MQPTDPAVFKDHLLQLCASQNVRLLYACESGSRGWGFPSPDSDYDVRFIYVRPLAHYLSVVPKSDQIQLPITGDLDFQGWDLRKALALMGRSNVTPFEWLQSPVVYFEEPRFREALWELSQHFFNSRANIHHYLGIATGALKSLDGAAIGVKKLFYVLRPLLAAQWCLERATIAPMQITPLLLLLPEDLQAEVKTLIQLKATWGRAIPSP